MLATLAAAAIGVVIIYTATRTGLVANGVSSTYYLKRQAIFVLIALVVTAVVALIDYRRLESVAMAIYGLMILALLAVFVVGSSAQGSARWFSLGFLQIQPSEFAVLALILAVATYCARREEGLTWLDVVRLMVMALIPIVLVVKQPDLGTGIVMTITLFVMLGVAGLPGRVLFLLVLAAALAVFGAYELGFLHHYQITRITSFLHQDSHSQSGQTAIYNLQQSKDAIGSGGLFGSGLFHGAQTNGGYVPEQQTDFIFTAIGEQVGFVGSAVVLFILGVVGFRILRAAQLARDSFGRLLCAGMFTFFAYSVFQNAGMTMGLMPITGIPLPFISYGGSAVISFFIAVGVAQSVYARRIR